MKKLLCLMLALVMVLAAVGCGQSASNPPASSSDPAPAAPTRAILMVSFGTSYNETRSLTIDAIEADVANAYPDWEVRRAFTAQTINDILADRDQLQIDNVTQAMERLVADGVKEVVVQPTHVMNGAEYDDMVAEVSAFSGSFDSLRIGNPLLTAAEDYQAVINALFSSIPEVSDEKTAIVFMGHGTHHFANAAYSQMELMMHSAGYENAFVGTVEGYPSLDDVLGKVAASGATRVILYPLMVVAGDHATNDMAGEEADSWKSAFTAANYEVEARLEGLGQFEGIRSIYLSHLQAAMSSEPITAPAAAAISAGANDPAKKAIVVTSFGTSYNDTRSLTIEAVEADIAAAYPDWEIRRAFTAQTVIDILADRDQLEVDNLSQALEKLVAEGYGTVVIQPTHIMAGAEYDDVIRDAAAYKSFFSSLTVASPLLMSLEDYEATVEAVADYIPEAGADDTAVLLMGHGTHHFANAAYSQLQNVFWSKGYDNVFVGTVEGYPTYDDAAAQIAAFGAQKVVLYPFMIVAGDHATNDMAGDEDDSWKVMLQKAGYNVETRLEGLGQIEGIRDLIIEHLSTYAGLPVGGVSFAFTGGSGRTTIECDELLQKDGKDYIRIVFSSKSYTSVTVDGVVYPNENEGAQSTFTIPINLNGQTTISGETTAMGNTHVVDYVLYTYNNGTDAAAAASAAG